jgi:hypothetical protein
MNVLKSLDFSKAPLIYKDKERNQENRNTESGLSNFRPITLSDRDILNSYLLENPYGICDFSFGNIYIWQHKYNTRYTLHKGFLILRAGEEGEHSYLMPLGKGNLKEVMEDLFDLEGDALRFSSITPHMEEELRDIMPDGFKVVNPDDFCDYIYLSENMITLKGKKFNGKRNHINKFMSLYSDKYEYTEINDSLIEECKEMNRKWCLERDCRKSQTDYCETMRALDNYKEIGLKGGVLKVEDEVVAFTLGQKNNDNTFNVLIEKALGHIEGAYPMINKEFAAQETSDFMYINREEDMGEEGLKKAKLSYRPHLLLMKGMGVFQ